MVNVLVKDGHEMFTGTQAKDVWPQYAKEAKKDLTVYKVLEKRGSRYYGMHTGFHFTKGKCHSDRFRMAIEWDHLTIDRGFHSFPQRIDCELPPGHVWAKFVIPKGSHYFVDSHDGEIVSQTITFESELL